MYIVAFSLTLTLVCGSFVKEPSDIVYRRGAQTTGKVDCEVEPGQPLLIWSFQQFGSGDSVAIYVKPSFVNANSTKYSIRPDAADTGNFTLTIHNLSRSDTGKYSCQVNGIVRAANLTVADPPQEPVFSIAETLVENTTTTFTCRSVGGFPLPEYIWLLDGNPLSVQMYKNVKEDGVVTKSELSLQLKSTYHRSKLVCRTTNILSSANKTVEMNVEFSPRVSIAEQNLIVLRNKQFQLTCGVLVNPAYIAVTWLRGNDVISGADGLTYTAGSGVVADTQFICRVENKHGFGEGSTSVKVHYAPEVNIREGSSIAVNEFGTLTLNCEVDAQPEASVKWMRGDQVMSTTSRLSVNAVGRQDAGQYRCVAVNIVTPSSRDSQQLNSSSSISVTVNYIADTPQLKVNPVSSSGYYRVEEKVQLECEVSDLGSPEAEIRWYKESSSNTPLSQTGANLQIDVPQVTDTDKYWCSAQNIVGNSRSNAKSLKFMDVPELLPTDNQKEANVSLSEKGYSIQCSYMGFPAPGIKWYKDGQLITDQSQYEITQEETEADNFPYRKTMSSLLFVHGGKGVVIQDSGSYRCVASNRAGESLQQYEKQINVIYPPHYEGHGKVAANLSSSVTIPCEVSSYPPVTSITFRKGDAKLTDDIKYTLNAIEYEVGGTIYRQRREISIADVKNSDYGTYSCVAVNAKGTKQFDIVMSRASKPDPPTALEYSDVSWHSVHLTWQAGFDGGYTQTYSVHMFYGSVERVSNKTKDTEYTATGLTPMTEYIFHVYSQNMMGLSTTYIHQVVTTPKLLIPLATLVFDETDNTLHVGVNTTEYCTRIQGSNDGVVFTDVFEECSVNSGRVSIADLSYTSYRALTCVPTRPDVCSETPSMSPNVDSTDNGEDRKKVITIAVVVSIFVVIIIIIVVVAVVVLRKRKNGLQKSAANSSKTGHINPIMTPNGVPGEVQYSNHTMYNINSDLEMEDEIDALPYGELKSHRESPQPSREKYENLDYVYASVQKKPSEQNKLNEISTYQVETHPHSMNIQDPSSISDNSDPDVYNSQLPSPYQGPDDLTEFLGPDVMAFRRLPSLSESAYSTPDSKQLKKVVYEVIV